jgi:5-(carboxyamino)imidazole ribonucleotide synthase
MTSILPGATVGILGGGQLGRMLAVAAAQLGYRTHVYAPEASGPATEVAAEWSHGAYDDAAAMQAFATAVDVVTYEFENVDPRAVAALEPHVPVRPSAGSLDVSRYRIAEKELAAREGGRTAEWRAVDSLTALHRAVAEIGAPAILKTTLFGYDGKGQARIDTPADAAAAWAAIGPAVAAHGAPAILEGRVTFEAEFSVILARAADGAVAVWDTPENVHREGILRTSTAPASPAVLAQAEAAVALARRIAERLGHVGVLTCEFFATPDGPVFNEMAPRVTIRATGRSRARSARNSRTTSAPSAACRSARRDGQARASRWKT